MKTVPKQWTIYTVSQRQQKINPKPQYQRAPVWSLAKKQKLIDSILRGYDIPKFYFRSSPDKQYEHEVVDGQQRLRAIWEFKNNEYPLGEESSDLPLDDISDKCHNELSSDIQDQFGLFELSIVIIEDADELEIRDLFLRLQEGVALNPAEKRNAMTGNVRDFVAEIGEHRVFHYITMSAYNISRFGRDDWIAHILCLEIAGNIVDVKATNLQKLYTDNQSFDTNGTVAQKVKRVLNYLARVLEPETPEMGIKWGFVDLYWLISTLIEEYDLTQREKDIQNFFITFEQRRRNVDDIDVLARSQDPLDRSLFDYIQAFQRSGATRSHIQKRNEVYREWLHNLIPDLVPKDQTRDFNRDERMILWRKAQETCENCGTKIPFNEMHADHVIPHSRGGKTTLSNAQCLCSSCNWKKSNR